jgi:hypothetical protein
MIEPPLARIFFNQWVVMLMVSCALLALSEVGFRLGLKFRKRDPEAARGLGGGVPGAVLGLLGLLLSFSFAMAVGRFDARRALVVQEASSIRATWLRTEFIPAPYQGEVRDLLIRYTQLKLDSLHSKSDDDEISKTRKEAAEIHKKLWLSASAAAAERPTPITATFITALNETINLDSSRNAALRNHVPGAVWLLLLMVASCGVWASGYGCGTSGWRSVFNQLAYPILIAGSFTLISDIDRAHKGLVGMSSGPFEELLGSMRPEK